MIATVSPCSSTVEHTLNTLRYAYRVKELQEKDKRVPQGAIQNPQAPYPMPDNNQQGYPPYNVQSPFSSPYQLQNQQSPSPQVQHNQQGGPNQFFGGDGQGNFYSQGTTNPNDPVNMGNMANQGFVDINSGAFNPHQPNQPTGFKPAPADTDNNRATGGINLGNISEGFRANFGAGTNNGNFVAVGGTTDPEGGINVGESSDTQQFHSSTEHYPAGNKEQPESETTNTGGGPTSATKTSSQSSPPGSAQLTASAAGNQGSNLTFNPKDRSGNAQARMSPRLKNNGGKFHILFWTVYIIQR